MTSATAAVTATLAALPAIGATFEGGTFCGITTLKDGRHHAVVLLPAKPDKSLAWSAANDWAHEVGGELPTRPVAALLYANAKPQLQAAWHWTADTLDADTGDQDDASFAWGCDFNYGSQGCSPKSASGAAVAVRLIPLSA